MAVSVKVEDLSLSGTNEASIKNHALLNALVNQPKEALELLKSTHPSIELSQISVDEYGTVVIDNDDVREFVKGIILNPVQVAGNNTYCGLSCII
jgi:hypothetical protein